MYPSTRRGPAKGAALLAVLQTLLLLSALVLAPAAVIAQDTDPGAGHDAGVGATGASPAAEPTLSEQGLTIRIYPQKIRLAKYGKAIVSAWLCPAGDRTPFGGQTQGDGRPGTKDDDCEPVRVKWAIKDGDSARLSNRVGYKTRVTLMAARENHLIATVDDLKRKTRIVVKERAAKVRPEADALIKQLRQGQPSTEPKQSSQAGSEQPKAEATVEQPQSEQPGTESPTDEPPLVEDAVAQAPAEECDIDPVTGECLVAEQASEEPTIAPSEEPTAEPQAENPGDEPQTEDPGTEPEPSAAPEEPTIAPSDEPTAEPQAEEPGDQPEPSVAPDEPTIAPSDEPTAEPLTEGPTTEADPTTEPACDIDPVTGVCVGEAPTLKPAPVDPTPAPADPTAAPKAETSTRVVTLAADGTLRIRKGGDKDGVSAIAPLAGARFDVWRDDGDNRFEPGSGDQFVALTGATNGSGYVDINLPQGNYWVRENSAPAGWNAILQIGAEGSYNSNAPTNPYAFRYSVSGGQTTTTRIFVNSRDNNPYPDVCGLNVAMVFDRSGSIDDGEYATMRNAAKAFVDSLSGTPSSIALYTFREQAIQNLAFTSVANGGGAVKTAIDNMQLPSGGPGTNWDAGFRIVAGDGAQVIVFLTDGNPTQYNATSGDNSTVSYIDVESGVAAANLAKVQSAQPKIVAVGVGNAINNPINLKLISGPVENDDYFISSFENLASTLQDIALKLCGGTVTVLKQVPDGNGGWEPASGWTFSAASSGSAPTPGSGQTNQDGVVNFDFDLEGNVTATITETVQSGWELVQQGGQNAVCQNEGQGISETNVANGVSFTLGISDIVTCRFRNQRSSGTITLQKTVINDNGGDATEADFQASLSGGIGNVAWDVATPVSTGTYTASESSLPGYTAGTWGGDCAADGTVTVGPGQNKVCTITNDDQPASLVLRKVVTTDNGGSATPDQWDLFADALSVTGSTAGAEVTDQAGTYALSESAGPAGYSNTSITCDDSQGQVTSVTVGLGETVTCTFVNDDQPATIVLRKTVVGGDATQADFDAYIDAVQVAWGAVTSLAPGDYTASEVMNVPDYVSGEWTGDCAADGSFSIALGDALECAVTNYHAEIEITKSVDPGFYAEVGDVVSYTITATNTGAATLTNVDISDEFPGGLDDWQCTPAAPATLAPGASIVCTATHTITEADIEAGQVFNQACVDTDQTADEVCDDTTVLLSELEIVKEADVDYFNAAGDVIDYTITATNTGRAPLTDVDISDALIDGLDSWTCTPPLVVDVLQPGESIICTASYTITAADVEAGEVFNQACADSDETPEVCDETTTPLAELVIEKSATPDTYSAAGEEIVYTVTAINTGEATLTDVDISDALIDGLDSWTCRVGDTVVNLPVAQLLTGQAITCTATYTITEDDVTGSEPEGNVPNTACAVSDQTPEVCDDFTVYEIVIDLVKSVTPTVLPEPGGVFTYTLTIDNESVVPLTITELVDDNSALSPDWAANCAVLLGTTLAPDAPGTADEVSCTYTVERTVAGTYPNTAQVTGTDRNGKTARDRDDVSVRVLRSELVIEKEASVDYYTGAGETIVYTVTATNTGEATLTDVDISDALIDGLDSWTCDPGNPVASLAAGESIVCTATYTITAADVEAGSVFNQACVDSDQTAEVCDDVDVPYAELVIEKTASSSVFAEAGDQVVYTVTATNTGEATLTDVDISDALIDGLDSWTCDPGNPVASLAAGESIVCTATYTITAADVEAGSVFNQACVVSGEFGPDDRICDEVTIREIDVTIEKTPSRDIIDSGDEVTFTIVYSHDVPVDVSVIYAYSLTDDVFGDLFDAGNTAITDNTCAGGFGQILQPNTDYTCQFTAVLTGTPDDPHRNTATIVVTDVDPVDPPVGSPTPRFARDSDPAVVGFRVVSPTPLPTPTPKPSQKPTDMLPPTDAIGPGSGTGQGGLLGWAVWVLLSAALIAGSGWVIRSQRLAEVPFRRR